MLHGAAEGVFLPKCTGRMCPQAKGTAQVCPPEQLTFKRERTRRALCGREEATFTPATRMCFLIIWVGLLPPCFWLFNLVYSANSLGRREPLILESKATVSFYSLPLLTARLGME